MAAGLACTVDDPAPDPFVIRTSVERPRRAVAITRPSHAGADAVTAPHFEGGDWAAFRLEDGSLEFPEEGPLLLEVEVSTRALAELDAAGHTRGHRHGRAELVLGLADETLRVPIEFAPRPSPLLQLLPPLALGLGWLVTAARSVRASDLGLVGFIGLVLAVLPVPLGAGVCTGRLFEFVGPRELAQCRESLGGFPLVALALPLAPIVGFLGLLYAASERATQRTFAAIFVSALACVAAFHGSDALEFDALVEHQRVAGWGILRHPFAFLAFLWAATAHAQDRGFLERIVLALVGATCFFGGAHSVELPAHGLAIGVGILVLAAKAAFLLALAHSARRVLLAKSEWLTPVALSLCALDFVLSIASRSPALS
jgi:hypothetical protein